MTRPLWEDGQNGKQLSRREIIQQLLLIVDAMKRMEHQRAGTAAGIRGELVDLGAVRGVAAKHAAGGREYAKAGGSAESCLRMRYGERHPGLRDWQKQIMENDRRGKHEERITV